MNNLPVNTIALLNLALTIGMINKTQLSSSIEKMSAMTCRNHNAACKRLTAKLEVELSLRAQKRASAPQERVTYTKPLKTKVERKTRVKK